MTTQEARFHALQERWRIAEEKREAFRYRLFDKYRSFTVYDHEMTKAERTKRESLQRAADKIGEALLTLLDEVSPRRWRSGAPYHWIMEHLTWADAITAGPLSVIPPPAYGMVPSDMRRFAAALSTAA